MNNRIIAQESKPGSVLKASMPCQWVQKEVTTETLERKGKVSRFVFTVEKYWKGCSVLYNSPWSLGIALELNFHGIGFWSVAEPAVTSSAANLFSMTMERGSAQSLLAVSMLDGCLWLRDLGQRPHDDGVCSSQRPQWLCWRRWGQRQDVTQWRRCYRTAARTCLWNNHAKRDKADEGGFFSLFPSAGVSLELMRCLATLHFPFTGYAMMFYCEKMIIFSEWMQTNGNNEDTNSSISLKDSFNLF